MPKASHPMWARICNPASANDSPSTFRKSKNVARWENESQEGVHVARQMGRTMAGAATVDEVVHPPRAAPLPGK